MLIMKLVKALVNDLTIIVIIIAQSSTIKENLRPR
jgi:hypothetical protein